MSTAEDYWRFGQMMLNRGTMDGARLLRPATVDLMRTNVLEPGVALRLFGPVIPGNQFGLDLGIIADPRAAGSMAGAGSYYWSGAFGTWWWNDPVNELVVIGMIQNENGVIPGLGTPDVRAISGRNIYAALARA
jgi:CubicO group peptidase (beta-lactamase class C family)